MKLMSLRLTRFRRFESETLIDLAPPVVALIGPNEAGKSTVLDALILLNPDSEFAARDQTRGHRGHETSIEADFLLEEEDRLALKSVRGGEKIRTFSVEKTYNGRTTQSYFTLVDWPKRDLTTRVEMAHRLRTITEAERILARFNSVGSTSIATAYDEAMLALNSSDDDLSSEALGAIRKFGSVMMEFPGVKKPGEKGHESVSSEMIDLLKDLAAFAEPEGPSDEAIQILEARMPRFVYFTEADRNLETYYPVESLASAPLALANLARLANLDLVALKRAASPELADERASILNRANQKLKERFAGIWPQFDVAVNIALNLPNLEITISTPDGDFSLVSARSDGLRAFVALRAFLGAHERESKPILLIDEAESHLHYDAQASLVNMLSSQSLVSKVIYSTHSVGCLPMDLGTGIRVVMPKHGQERSEVRKSIWDGKFAGFSPLVFAMGATTFAFLPARNVLMAEGDSDAMLLPTLFREALSTDGLEFQVAPGISSISSAEAGRLQSEGGSVLYITDGDEEGKRLRDKLIGAGVKKSQIFSLEEVGGNEFVLEDLLDINTYCSAINAVIGRYVRLEAAILETDLPGPNRPNQLEAWCSIRGIKSPQKHAVCQELLDYKATSLRANGQQLLSSSSRSRLAKLARKLIVSFNSH